MSDTPVVTWPTFYQEQCLMNCADKFLKHSERINARFTEQSSGAQPVFRPVLRADDEAFGRRDECRSTKIANFYSPLYLPSSA